MCIIQGRVETVAGTKIFVAPLADGVNQLTVYCNRVKLGREEKKDASKVLLLQCVLLQDSCVSLGHDFAVSQPRRQGTLHRCGPQRLQGAVY